MKLHTLLCLLFAGYVLCATGASADVPAAKGVFVSCKGCSLNRLPEVRRFFYDSVIAGEYGDKLEVNFKHGAVPELVLYNATNEEISRTRVNNLNFDQLHELVQGHGFTKVVADSSSEQQPTEKAAAPAGSEDSSTQAAPADAPAAAVESGVFVSCRSCKLKRLPEVRRFFYDSVLEGEYDKLSVQFKGGAVPELVLYNAAQEEISRTGVSDYTFDELHELVQGHGFVRKVRQNATTDLTATRGVFESCKACKLRRRPEVRRFFYDSVMAGEYGDKLEVKFKNGAVPELVLYNAADEFISRTDVSEMTFDQLHELVQGHGFTKEVEAEEQAEEEQPTSDAADGVAAGSGHDEL